jgi:hypothetical protein
MNYDPIPILIAFLAISLVLQMIGTFRGKGDDHQADLLHREIAALESRVTELEEKE